MWQKVKNSIWLNILLLAAAGFFAYHAFFMVRDAVLLKQEERARAEEIDKVLKKKAELEAYLREIETKEAVVREAKERFNLKLPGEKVVVVVPDDVRETEAEAREPTASLWERVKSLFLKHKTPEPKRK